MTSVWIGHLRDVPDFPEPGIVFKDITPILSSATAFESAVGDLTALAEPLGASAIVGVEARGFIFGAPVARQLGTGFVPVRKPGKLPRATRTESFELEYGSDSLEAHLDAVGAGQGVVIVDDVLATGGTAEATCRLVEGLGGVVLGVVVLVELGFLDGARRLGRHRVHSALTLGGD
ncbi:MAG TPA: adenine phosphoribosyltransferase [Acidimicrobiales bacterium]|nr:adenine phosphoribosyltransferase [Acidimicrobiales bacterium]